MKCSKCAAESNKKERVAANGRCAKCGRAFVFDPPDPLSDAQIAEAMAKLTKKDALHFTKAQAVCEIDRVLARREYGLAKLVAIQAASPTAAKIVLAACVVGAIGCGVAEAWPGMVIASVLAMVCAWFIISAPKKEDALARVEANRKPRAALTNAETVATKWLASEHSRRLLAASVDQHAPGAAREFDLDSYGFDRVVVVQGDDMVDALVANQFHFQHNAAIVSFTGYPKHVADLVLKQLKATPEAATLYLLHDASSEGYALAQNWLEKVQGAKVVRVGLSPRQVAKIEPKYPSTALPHASAPEALKSFLTEHRVPLAALRPEQVMILLFNAISAGDRSDVPITPGEMGVIVYDGDWSVAADAPYDFG